MTVSYTHLDVYKRQMVDSTVYLTGEQKVASERVIGRVYGSRGYGLSGDCDGA